MAVTVSFSDLSHTGQLVAANTFPLGSLMVAAYANKVLGDEIEFEVFRYPEEFSAYLEKSLPQIACFSCFSWNMHLSHSYATKLKELAPQTIIVIGGPNIPNTPDELEIFLQKYPAVDFCVEGEGELAFVELYNAVKKYDFNIEAVKNSEEKIPNTSYLTGNKMIKGDLLPRIMDLEIIPSTFENGLSDKFFDKHLIPMLQTSRGCPYSCSFCHDGDSYYTKTRRVSQERVKEEIEYIAERALTPDLIFTDLNFGMFAEDVETSKYLASVKERLGWPKYIHLATAKNHKDQILDISRILQGSLQPGAAVQSTNPDVLKNIKRTNLPLEAILEVAKTAEVDGANSFSEVILCLPGDSKRAHFQSLVDTINAGFLLIRTYQFLMLLGTEAASKAYRTKYAMETRFRVKPMNIGTYGFRDSKISSIEIEEICVANNTMSFEDYCECRKLSLTVETFNNNGLFFDVFQFLSLNGIPRSEFLMLIHDQVLNPEGEFFDLYKRYSEEENNNLCNDEKELRDFVSQDGIIDRYISGELGINEIYKYRIEAIFDKLDLMHDIAFSAARSLLKDHGKLTELNDIYIDDLKRLSLLRKHNVFDTDWVSSDTFHFDFVQLVKDNFSSNPISMHLNEPVELRVFHSDEQIDHIAGYKNQFGVTKVGLGRILNRAHISSMYRSVEYVE